ncbi:hypothetical protein H8356DRAFT_991039 [Neocallimastix lanati (nom. inval.)]|jgi:hypothetical protein|nr:hypothetical protein H8356DRAFT_991039 [Neocallimastix sp. JGI-2020a]
MRKIQQLKQWTNEKVGRSKKPAIDEELQQLITETDLHRQYFEKLQKVLGDYIHIYDKKIDFQGEKKTLPVNAIGLLTVNFGSSYSADSALGKALLKFGKAHTKLSEYQADFVSRTRKGFEIYLNSLAIEMKSYSQLKKKYDHRRLDLDDIQERVKKSSKEKPQLVQELRVQEDKYEETLDELTRKIFNLKNSSNKHIDSLKEFCLSEIEYHRNSVEVLSQAYDSMSKLHEKEGSYTSFSTNSYSNPATSERRSTNNSNKRSSYSSYQNSLNQESIISYSSNSTYASASPVFESPSLRSSIISHTSRHIAAQKPIRQVRANFDFTAEASNELSLKAGDIINVIAEIDEGWWQGEIADGSGRSGIFPHNYTTEITPHILNGGSLSSLTTSISEELPIPIGGSFSSLTTSINEEQSVPTGESIPSLTNSINKEQSVTTEKSLSSLTNSVNKEQSVTTEKSLSSLTNSVNKEQPDTNEGSLSSVNISANKEHPISTEGSLSSSVNTSISKEQPITIGKSVSSVNTSVNEETRTLINTDINIDDSHETNNHKTSDVSEQQKIVKDDLKKNADTTLLRSESSTSNATTTNVDACDCDNCSLDVSKPPLCNK